MMGFAFDELPADLVKHLMACVLESLWRWPAVDLVHVLKSFESMGHPWTAFKLPQWQRTVMAARAAVSCTKLDDSERAYLEGIANHFLSTDEECCTPHMW